MIQELHDITPHLDWIDDLCQNTAFSTPFCNRERVISSSKKEDHILLGAYEGKELIGIFCLLALADGKYMETSFLYSKEKKAYVDLLDYLAGRYPGYEIWFVYNPQNFLLQSLLTEKQAFFYTEQRCMIYKGNSIEDIPEIIPYCDMYRDEYIAMHSKDSYWDGDKVLASGDDFAIFLCVRNHHLVGYIESSRGNDTCEVMDLRVLPEYRNQGIGGLLLQKAIYTHGGDRLILTVDIDNAPALHLYEKMGFEEIKHDSSVTAKLHLGYRFWGWEHADAPAISNEFKGIKTPIDLYDALTHIWGAETCAPRMRNQWTEENRTLGQCSITAFLAQDIFGGKVYGILRPGGNYHCYNVIGDCSFDLTSEQFGHEVLDYENNPEQFREVHFSKEEKRLRYEFLKTELKKYCNLGL